MYNRIVNYLLSHWAYLFLLIISIVGLSLADWRYRLAWWHNRNATLWAIVVSYSILLLGDIAGIGLRIFSTNQTYVSGLYVMTPNLPIEEFFFLYLLCYVTLLVVIVERKVFIHD